LHALGVISHPPPASPMHCRRMHTGTHKAKGLVWDRGDDRVLGCIYAFEREDQLAERLKHFSLVPGVSNPVADNARVRADDPAERPGLVLVGVDNSFLNRANSKKFTTVRLRDEYLRTDEPDPLEVENRKLKSELEKLKDNHPKLELLFEDGSREKNVVINSDLADDFALPFLREHSKAKEDVFEEFRLRRGEISARASEEDFYFKEFVDKQAAAMEIIQRVSPVGFLIRNDGHHPAKEVRITIHLADEIEAVDPVVPFPEDHLQPRTYAYDKRLLAGKPMFANRTIRLDPPERQPDFGVLGPLVVRGARDFRYQIGHVGDLAGIALPAANVLFTRAGARAVLKYEVVASGVPRRFSGELVINIVREPRRPPAPLPEPQ
jgi:hypothetical protein